jgi:DNA-binding NarL/FixJ family response regulator
MRSGITSSDRPRVLLVDDNGSILSRAAAVLAHDCTVVGKATDGTAALEAVAALGPDVVVLDISMPGQSGLDVASHLLAGAKPPAIVFLTVHDEAEIAAVARALGALAYVVKARLATDLVPAVRAAFGGRPFVSPLR